MKKSTVCGKGICPDCGASIGSALTSWKRHRLTCKSKKKPIKKKVEKEYWMCIIGGVPKNKLGWGADGPLRMTVRNKFFNLFGDDDVCSSGWGINQERYEVLSSLHMLPTEKLKSILKKLDKSKTK